MIRPPTRPSTSARVLREQLHEIARLSRSNPVPSGYQYLLNWGNPTDVKVPAGMVVLNKPESIRNAANKLSAFKLFEAAGVPIPKYRTEAPRTHSGIWLARGSLTGSGGRGITVVRKGDSFPTAPLYVEYVPKTVEYRVHVVNGKAIFTQQKKRERDNSQTKDQKLIRNYDNGWVFCLVDGDPPKGVKDAAVSAVAALGLDYGAVDIVVSRDTGKPVVLECNTAPGLASPTLIAAYKEAFTAWLTNTSSP